MVVQPGMFVRPNEQNKYFLNEFPYIIVGNCSNLLLLLWLLEESQYLYYRPNDINIEKVRCCENI